MLLHRLADFSVRSTELIRSMLATLICGSASSLNTLSLSTQNSNLHRQIVTHFDKIFAAVSITNFLTVL